MVNLTVVNTLLRHCHSWLARKYMLGDFSCFLLSSAVFFFKFQIKLLDC